MPTPHVTAINRNGAKQVIPRAWLDEDSPFYDQFTLTPSQRQREERSDTPDDTWTVAQLREHADRADIDLTGATTKADVLSAINQPAPGAEKE